MDTRYRLLDTPGTEFFRWDHINSVSVTQGSINTVGVIRDIVALRVYPIRLPYHPTLDNIYKRITMLIKEFQGQSFVGQENRRFHFVFNPLISGDSVYLQPENNNDGYFRFSRPITQFDTITLDFGNPLEQVQFTSDRLKGFTSQYNDNLQTHFQTDGTHNLLTGNNVYIENFSSLNNLATASVTNQINRDTGHIVIATGTNTFKINIDSSSMTPAYEGGGIVTLNNATITGLSVTTALPTGTRIHVTSDPAVLPLTLDEVFNVNLFDFAGGIIYLDRDPGLGVVNPVWVNIDYRPPPLTSSTGNKLVSPVAGITVTANTPGVGQSTVTGGVDFINEFKVGGTVVFIQATPVIYDGPHIISSITNESTMIITRVSALTLVNVSAVASTTLIENRFNIYFGSKRIFVPMEITYLSPEV